MNNITDNEKIEKNVQKPCSNTSKSGANADKSRGSGKSMNMSPMMCEYLKTKENTRIVFFFIVLEISMKCFLMMPFWYLKNWN